MRKAPRVVGQFQNECPTCFSLSFAFDKLKLVGHLLLGLIRTVAAAALATVTTPQQKLSGENEQTVLDVVVAAFL